MNPYATAKDLFVDSIDLSGYFDSLTFEFAKKSLMDAMTAQDTPLIFLLGAPGSGKSFLLTYVTQKAPNLKVAKHFTHPYFDDKEFLEILLGLSGKKVEHDSMTTEALMSELKKTFRNLEHTILIDEAQLLTEEQIELIRILSDQRIFQFVLAMHKKEGQYILQKDHFKSRTSRVIEIEALQDHEIARYLENRLISNNLSDLASLFKKRHIAYIAELTQRNFRTVKKLLRTLFEVMNIAHKENLDKSYLGVSDKTLTMAAIDIGLIDVKS